MLIKEYRIPLPLTVEEYKIAQLYMIAKKSREESQGSGSGVEILKNEPYTDGPGGSGQYTYKIYHVGHHLPAWLKTLFPRSFSQVQEEAWNSYPYTKTRYTCPLFEKFFIEIETKYFNDCGNQPNVFNLSRQDSNRQIDVIDIVKEQMLQNEYLKEEDPRLYVSTKTKRGPLPEDWVQQYWNNGQTIHPIMCAYKLCRVEFKYWGMQSKIEKFIHDSALRKTMVRAHQQAWVWQDEWVDLSMADIRRLELETQEYLRQRMAESSENANEVVTESGQPLGTSTSSPAHPDFNLIDKDNETCSTLQFDVPKSKKNSLSQYSLAPSHLSSFSRDSMEDHLKRKSTIHSPGECIDVISAWRVQSLARDSESSDDEFYDAEDIRHQEDFGAEEYYNEDNIFSSKFMQQVQSELISQSRSKEDGSLPESPSNSPTHQSGCSISTLIIILHGGSVLDVSSEANNSKNLDITTFKTAMDTIIQQHYSHLTGRIVIRYVSCPPICLESLLIMSSLSPYSVQSSPSAGDGPISHAFDSIPISALPLFAVSAFDYHENVASVVAQCNKIYADFLKSDEGKGFCGKVCLIGDSIGAILGFDALCNSTLQSNLYGSELSIQNGPESLRSLSSNPIISINDSMDCDLPGSCDVTTKSKVMSSGSTSKAVPPAKPQVYGKSLSHPGDTSQHDTQNRLYINSVVRRRSSGSSDITCPKFDFDTSDFFMFGSLIGIVLTYRKMLSLDDKTFTLLKPACANIYNLFHLNDPSALRIEPLLSGRFSYISPVNVPRYQMFPLGDGQPIHLLEYLQTHSHLFNNENPTHGAPKPPNRRTSEISITSNDNLTIPNVNLWVQRWWGSKRIDYALYSPEGLSNFPTHSLPHLFHSSYWESSDVISFILRQINKTDLFSFNAINSETREVVFKPNQSREKWQRKRTSVKLKNITANHRANDVIIKEGHDQIIVGRFVYGPLDVITLTGEKVDIHMRCPRTGEWKYLGTEVTDKNGRVSHQIPKEKTLPCGLYQFKMVVRGDHTFLDLFLAVIPPKTEAVVFSIDGSLTASVSVSGRDPKIRAGAIDVARMWQELGYLIIYITGRPDMQQQRVVSWLYQHNFPHGLIFFADGISTDPLRHKAEYLKYLNQKVEIVFKAAYGSSKDITVYQSLDMKPEQIYIVGKVSKKQQSMANVLADGYVAHLDELRRNGHGRLAQVNARVVLPKGAFVGVRNKQSGKAAKRATSFPMTGVGGPIATPTTTASNGNNTGTSTAVPSLYQDGAL